MLNSLRKQTTKNFELILITEKGSLSVLRQKGLLLTRGDTVSFIDDDIYCPSTWLESIFECFREGVVGVTGPTTIKKEYQKNRDCLKWPILRKACERFFEVSGKPGHLSPCGAPSMESNFQECLYEGEVQYLECCNMSLLRNEDIYVGGFDNHY